VEHRHGRAAAVAAGLNAGEAQLLLPQGPKDLAALLSRRHDKAALATLGALDPPPAKIRDKIRSGVIARLDAAAGDARAFAEIGRLSGLSDQHAPGSDLDLGKQRCPVALGGRHGDRRESLFQAGDPVGILVSTLAVDMASGRESALKHLEGRIDNVMAFEKWKAGIKPMDLAPRWPRRWRRCGTGGGDPLRPFGPPPPEGEDPRRARCSPSGGVVGAAD
jgi:ubiquinone biosynthesis protein COQ9